MYKVFGEDKNAQIPNLYIFLIRFYIISNIGIRLVNFKALSLVNLKVLNQFYDEPHMAE